MAVTTFSLLSSSEIKLNVKPNMDLWQKQKTIRNFQDMKAVFRYCLLILSGAVPYYYYNEFVRYSIKLFYTFYSLFNKFLKRQQRVRICILASDGLSSNINCMTWASYWTSLCLSFFKCFFKCTMKIVVPTPLQPCPGQKKY